MAAVNADDIGVRKSDVAYVLAKLRVRGIDYLLLNAHTKWGDWSLPGGHVETSDPTWAAAAAREVSEEFAPLTYGRDVELAPTEVGYLEWGPIPSRSAGGHLTRYRARCYALRFKADPRSCLSKLPKDEFLLVSLRDLENTPRISNVVERARTLLPRGWEDLPLAWEADLDDVPLRAS
jgi:hypothetical protein